MKGQIIRILSNLYTVESSEDKKIYECHSRGKFRNLNITPLVGDNVIFDNENNYILEILPRINNLVRPNVANVDQAFVITSCKEPDFSTNLLDKLLTVMEFNHIKPVICITKYDLLNKEEKKTIDAYLKYYKKVGYIVLKNNQMFKIKRLFKGCTTVFTGQTGAGKSTLINKLDKTLNLETGEISKALGRGRHTTRHVELHKLYKGKVLDTPGFSAIDLSEFSKTDIRDSFVEFRTITCDYKDCMHINEKECKVKENVENDKILESRYQNYLKFLSEVKK